MSKRNLRRIAVALAVAAALSLLPAAALAAPGSANRGPAGVAEHSTSFLSMVWVFLQNAWGGEGASLDPEGLRAVGAPNGGMLDPNGAPEASDTGGMLDPNGVPRLTGDNGGELDPNG